MLILSYLSPFGQICDREFHGSREVLKQGRGRPARDIVQVTKSNPTDILEDGTKYD